MHFHKHFQLEISSKAPCKRTQLCWPTNPNIVGCYMLRPFVHPVACCWMLLRVVAQSLKPVKLFSRQLPSFLLFCDRRSVALLYCCCSCCIRLHTTANTHATTPKNVGVTVLGVVAFVCTKPKCDIKAENSSTWCEFHAGRKGLRPMGSNADYLLLSPVLVLTLGTLRYEDGELGRRLNRMSKTRSSPVVPAKNK